MTRDSHTLLLHSRTDVPPPPRRRHRDAPRFAKMPSPARVRLSVSAVAYEHGAFVLLLDKEGAPRVEFPVEELTPEALAHDVRKLERE